MSQEQVQAFLKVAEDANFRAAFETANNTQAKRQLLDKAGLDDQRGRRSRRTGNSRRTG